MGFFNTLWTWETASNTRVLRRDVQARQRDARRRARADAKHENAQEARRASWCERGPHSMPESPAGWYWDPFLFAALRYWDGTRWTEHLA